ncbi:MAG: VCBS repeat-containing protein [Thermoanaerobaculia bacterium]
MTGHHAARHVVGAVLLLSAMALSGRLPAQEAERPVATFRDGGLAEIDGMVLSALAIPAGNGAPSALWLLARPPRDENGARSLWRFDIAPTAQLERSAADLPGWMETLGAIDLGAGLELVAAGEGRLAALGVALGDGRAALDATGPRIVPRPLLDDPAFRLERIPGGLLRRGSSSLLLAVAPGGIRRWVADGEGGVRATGGLRIPFAIARESRGIRLSSPPVQPVLNGGSAGPVGTTPLFLGPEAVGRTRLRGRWLDLGAPAVPRPDLWAALPGPEAVSQSWPAEIDGTPVLIVRTQAADELNIFERQRLRVLPLLADRTRAGAPPTLAVELDSKRWHETEIALGDVDGDGRTDLLVAFPEGLSGTDLVVQWWRGRGQGRFEASAKRSDLEQGGEIRQLVPSPAPGEPPAVLLYRRGRLELLPFARSGRKALGGDPLVAATFESRANGGSKRRRNGEGEGGAEEFDDVELLGAIELDGLPGAELLALVPGSQGRDRLAFVRRRPPAASAVGVDPSGR